MMRGRETDLSKELALLRAGSALVPLRELGVTIAVLFVLFGLLALRLFYMQVIQYRKYLDLSLNNQVRTIVKSPTRGMIFDRKGRPLAKNEQLFSLMYFPSKNYEDDRTTVAQIEELLQVPQGVLVANLDNSRKLLYNYQPILLTDDLTHDQIALIEQVKERLPGIYINDRNFKRLYPLGSMAAHIVGYTQREAINEPVEPFLKGALEVTHNKGVAGAEAEFDSVLRGEQGMMMVEIDKLRHFKKVIQDSPTEDGQNVYLTLDNLLQEKLSGLLTRTQRPGTIIVSEIDTGEILAMVSSPSFNPSLFRGPGSAEYFGRLASDVKNAPLLNRAYQNGFPPGSAFKAVAAVAALKEGLVTPSRRFYCSGRYEISDRVFRCWKRDGHGTLSFSQAVAYSCDVTFYHLAVELGNERLRKYARLLGFGEKTGIDLPAENSGFLPSPAWKRRVKREKWFPGDTLNLVIGQGYLLTTPLQLLWMMNMIAGEGRAYLPRIVKSVGERGNLPSYARKEKPRETHLPREVFDKLKPMLVGVSSYGTARGLSGLPVRVAGKTGSAEDPPRKKPHSWFVGYFPAGRPKYSFVVFVQNGGDAPVVAVPLARQVVAAVLEIEREK